MLWGKFKFSFSFRARNVQWGILLKMVCCIVSWLIGRCTLEFCESLGYSSFPSYSFHSFCHPFLQSFVMQVSYHGQFIPFIVNSVSAQCSFTSSFILFSFTGASILGVEGREPPLNFGLEGGSWGSEDWLWTCREILFYLIMYRKYIQKWWLLKRNRKICPEVHVAVNEQVLPGKSNFFKTFAWKNWI